MITVRSLVRSIATAMLLAGLVLAPATLPHAAAENEVVWSVKPADNEHGNGRTNYTFAAEPGDEIEDAIVVTNYSDSPLTLSVYAADGFTTAEGLLDLVPTGTESTDLGTWVSVETTEITLDPGDQETITFTIEVPDDAIPGDHTGGLVTSLAGTAEGTNLAVDRRLASKINVRIAGALTVQAAVTDVQIDYHAPSTPWSAGSATVTYRIANTGNALMYATDRVRVAGPLGLGGASTPANEVPEILPRSSIERTVELSGVWPLVRATAAIEVQPVGVGVSGSVDLVTEQASTWALSWVWLSVLGVLLAGALIAAFRTLRTRRAARTPDGSSGATDTDLSDDDEIAALIEQAREEGRARARALATPPTDSPDPPAP